MEKVKQVCKECSNIIFSLELLSVYNFLKRQKNAKVSILHEREKVLWSKTFLGVD